MNDALINEEDLINYINNNQFSTYNSNIKNFLKFTFGNSFNSNLPFNAKKIAGQQKPDMCINHNGILKYISIKKGSGNSVHQEKIDVFFPYIENIIGTNELNNLKLFHFGDDTINDSGERRYNASESKIRYATEVSKLNLVLNNSSNITNFLDRFLFVGNVGNICVDVIYHGNIESGLWASCEEIINYVNNNNFDLNAVHFGPLTYQVWGRNEKWTAVHPDRRYIMQVKWGSIYKDLVEIRKEND